MTTIEKIRKEVERRYYRYGGGVKVMAEDAVDATMLELEDLLAFLDTLPDEKGGYIRDAEVIFNGHGLHTDVTKWADGYKLKIIIYDEY